MRWHGKETRVWHGRDWDVLLEAQRSRMPFQRRVFFSPEKKENRVFFKEGSRLQAEDPAQPIGSHGWASESCVLPAAQRIFFIFVF